jgi:hypothetical protein
VKLEMHNRKRKAILNKMLFEIAISNDIKNRLNGYYSFPGFLALA